MPALIQTMPPALWTLATALAVVVAAIALQRIALWAARRAVLRSRDTVDDRIVERLRRPMFWLVIAVALSAIRPVIDPPPAVGKLWAGLAGLLVPALIGWLVIALLGAAADFVKARADVTAPDNLRARRRRTRVDILNHVSVFAVLLATFCIMLMSIPSVRNVGVTLIASAGLAALAVGAAAQPALKNLIGGLQMAFTEPIRIDDVVVIEGEWGRIEQIYLTYVIVKIWDERRLVVPVTKFLESSFQNWTRETSAIMGSVIWHFDPATDVAALRTAVQDLVTRNPRWDGRFWNLQVTDTAPEAIEVRALMTARDASTAFDLRCDVREGLLAHVRAQMPAALVTYRHTPAPRQSDSTLSHQTVFPA
ncbi:MAG: mechanosensitive ion channel [Novosphingobium sp.]|nr:mechanosensitive ion channel [Novosphingobium sp.]